jgi:hypothetical protein
MRAYNLWAHVGDSVSTFPAFAATFHRVVARLNVSSTDSSSVIRAVDDALCVEGELVTSSV